MPKYKLPDLEFYKGGKRVFTEFSTSLRLSIIRYVPLCHSVTNWFHCPEIGIDRKEVGRVHP